MTAGQLQLGISILFPAQDRQLMDVPVQLKQDTEQAVHTLVFSSP